MAKDLFDLVNEEFGVKARAVVNPETSSIGTTAEVILSNNPSRVGWLIINLSTNVLYLHFENDVATSKAFGRLKQGEAASSIWDEDFNVTAWAIWALASGASSDVYAVEFVSY